MTEKLKKKNIDEIFELSLVQKGMLFHYLEEEQNIYNVQLSFNIKGQLDVGVLQAALKEVQRKNEVLRSVFRWEGIKHPVQIILKECALDFRTYDISKEKDALNELKNIVENDRQERFDLNRLPLRISIIKKAPSSFLLNITHHHILYDGWSTGIFLESLFQNYNRINGNLVLEDKVQPSYRKFYLERKRNNDSKAKNKYWEDYLNSHEPSLFFPERSYQSTVTDTISSKRFSSKNSGLEDFSVKHRITKSAIVYTAYGLLLMKYYNVSDVVFGTSVSDRNSAQSESERLMGNFINTIPLRVEEKNGESLLQLTKRINKELITRHQHNNTSLYEIKRILDFKGQNTLFDSTVGVKNYAIDKNLVNRIDGLDIELSDVYEKTNVPLAINVYFDSNLELEFNFKTSAFNDDEIENMATHYFTIIDHILNFPNQSIQTIEILSKGDTEKILFEFNDTNRDFSSHLTIGEIFQEKVRFGPKKNAVVFENKKLTYEDLNKRANQLANKLLEVGIVSKTNSTVGLMVEPSLELIIGIFGILKSGAAFIPIDPNIPSSRLDLVLSQAKLSTILTQNKFLKQRDKISEASTKFISIEGFHLSDYNASNPRVKLNPLHLLYVLFTSGTTGSPKGVLIMHKNMTNYFNWCKDFFQLESGDKWVLVQPFYFDSSYTTIFGAILSGSELHLLSKENYTSPTDLLAYLENQKISHMKVVPSLMSAVVECPEIDKIKTLKRLILGGEKIKTSDVKKIMEVSKETKVVNHYGPTEVTVGTIAQYIKASKINGHHNEPIIGKPIFNNKVYILDRFLKPLPIGIKGEIYLAGIGVAKGYLNDDKKTKERFIQNPFANKGKMYRTGDLGTWLPDGTVEFLGRADYQIKLRGHRIELGEIEAQLKNMPGIDEVVVVDRETGNGHYLTCYYVSKTKIKENDVRSFAINHLPDYMIPRHMVLLESIPTTANGKIDRRNLPLINDVNTDIFVEATTKEEQILSGIWSEVLNLDKVGILDNFFLSGGDSIKSIQISSRLRNKGFKASVKTILANPTIKDLSQKLEPLVSISDQAAVTGKSQLSPIQFEYLNSSNHDLNHYNQSVMLRFSEVISKDTISRIFSKIQEHHDALRLVFKESEGVKTQIFSELGLPVSLEEYDINKDRDSLGSIVNKLQSSIDLERGPLMKLGLFHMNDFSLLLIVIHHMVVDGISWRVLLEDIQSLYQQVKNIENLVLPLKTDSFKLWTKKLSDYVRCAQYAVGKSYWENFETGDQVKIPRDYPGGNNFQKNSKVKTFQLESTYTSKLLTSAHKSFGTQINDLLLSALLMGINKQYGHSSVILNLEGHGREAISTEVNVSRTVGWFTSIYPVVLKMGTGNISTTIKKVKEMLRSIPNRGIDYLVGKYYDLDFNSNIDAPQIKFNFLGQFDSDLKGKDFKISLEDRGKEVSAKHYRKVDWDLWGLTVSGKLEMNFSYSSEQYQESTIDSFIDHYKKSLVEIIDYCCSYGKIELTATDLTFKNIKPDKLDFLNDQYSLSNIYPLSGMQEGMLFYSLLSAQFAEYHEQKTLHFHGKINESTLVNSITLLVERHEILRTLFLHEGYERPLQMVLRKGKVDFQSWDVSDEIKKDGKSAVVRRYQDLDRQKKFNLQKDTLLRVKLLQISATESTLIWSHHHIIMDGWCMGILWQDIQKFYLAQLLDKKVQLSPTKKYSDYITWLESRDPEASIKYWQSYLEEFKSSTVLPKCKTSDTEPGSYKSACSELVLEKPETDNLNALSHEHGVTLNTIIQAAWAIVLSGYVYSSDILFGSVVSGRPPELDGVGEMVGLFINTVPVRVNLKDEDTVVSLMLRIQSDNIESFNHQYLPLVKIQSQSTLGRGLFDHIMVFENYPISETIEGSQLGDELTLLAEVTKVEVFEQTNYNLTIVVLPGKELKIQANYNENVYGSAQMESTMRHLNHILTRMMSDPNINIKDISVSKEDKRNLLELLNNQEVEWPKEKTLVDLFKNQVRQRPSKLAVEYLEEQLTYSELDFKSDQVAKLLRDQGMNSNEIVGLFLERSLETIIGMLGILKAGGCYMPIDVDYPELRISYMIEDSAAQIVLTTKNLAKIAENSETTVLYIEDCFEQPIEEKVANCVLSADALCYIIYTSGTTGAPKGVKITHKNAVRLFVNDGFQFDFKSSDIWTMFHSPCFDFSVWEIYGALLFGGKLIIIPKMIARDPKKYLETLRTKDVTVLNQTPTAFYGLIRQELNSVEHDLSLRYVIFGGESLSPGKLSKWRVLYPKIKLINMFGITETTVHVTYKEITEYEIDNNISNIGKPIPTLSVYILDKWKQLVPYGGTGELFVGGHGVSLGYLRKEKLTQEKFVENPFRAGERLYRSGDLARITDSGEIEYMGRMDSQTQLRGFRIELGEIENCLSTYPGIVETAVLDKEVKDEKYLIAYYTSEQEINLTLIRRYLSGRLSEYMIPSYFVHLKTLPITSNGKLDRALLPSPNFAKINESAMPKNEIQMGLVEIWAQILGLEKNQIGINTNFFDLGGNSLKLVEMVNIIYEHFQIRITVADAFSYPVISLLAQFLGEGDEIELVEESNYEEAQETIDILNQINNN